MKLPEIKPWRSSLTPANAWPFTSNIPHEVSGIDQGVNNLMRTFASDRDFTISPFNDFHAYPTIDIRETTDGYSLDADLPALTEKEIELELHNNVLSISGERKSDTLDSKYLCHERSTGSFYREISFEKEVNFNNIFAIVKNGVLHIELKKTNVEISQPHKIMITH